MKKETYELTTLLQSEFEKLDKATVPRPAFQYEGEV